MPPRRIDGKRGGRFYDTEDGLFASVTNILGVIGKPALMNWMAKTEREYVISVAAGLHAEGLKFINREAYVESLQQRLSAEKAGERLRNKAADIGSEVHSLIERRLRQQLGQSVPGPEPSPSDPALIALAQWEKWKSLVGLVPILMEQTVWSKAFGYAGTLDLSADLILPKERDDVKRAFSLPSDMSLEAFYQQHAGQKVRVIADFKTSSGVYLEARLQVAAYGHALQELGRGYADMGLIIRLPKIKSDSFEAVPVLNMDEEFATFLHVMELWKRVQAFDKERGWLKESA